MKACKKCGGSWLKEYAIGCAHEEETPPKVVVTPVMEERETIFHAKIDQDNVKASARHPLHDEAARLALVAWRKGVEHRQNRLVELKRKGAEMISKASENLRKYAKSTEIKFVPYEGQPIRFVHDDSMFGETYQTVRAPSPTRVRREDELRIRALCAGYEDALLMPMNHLELVMKEAPPDPVDFGGWCAVVRYNPGIVRRTAWFAGYNHAFLESNIYLVIHMLLALTDKRHRQAVLHDPALTQKLVEGTGVSYGSLRYVDGFLPLSAEGWIDWRRARRLNDVRAMARAQFLGLDPYSYTLAHDLARNIFPVNELGRTKRVTQPGSFIVKGTP